MGCSLAIKGIASAKILREAEEAFSKLAGVDFSFVDLRGKPFILPQRISPICKALVSSKKDSVFLNLLNKGCEHIITGKKPYPFDYNKLTFSLIPIIAEEKTIGAMLVCPMKVKDQPSRAVPKEQLKALSDLLFLVINYIFKNEFDFLVVSESDKQYSRNQEAVIKAMAYIKKSYHDKDISLEKVASEVALSHYYFSHIFKDEIRITFIEYLTKVRIEAAAKLLKNKNLNVNQIAFAVGYQDPNYFSKVFKKYMKTSPVEYRENLLKKGVEKQTITL